MNKTVIQSQTTKHFLVIDNAESGGELFDWTDKCSMATCFDSDEEAVNTIKRFGFFYATVVVCQVDYEANSG